MARVGVGIGFAGGCDGVECGVDVSSSDRSTKRLGLKGEGKGKGSNRLSLYLLYLTHAFIGFSAALGRLLSILR